MRRSLTAALLSVALLAPVLAGCTVNPATGERAFTAFMSPAQERQVGAEEHPRILEEMGGAYDDPELARYIDSIGQLLARTSEMPDLPFTFTVLNTDTINAFALPGGYVYVTRGLVALANNEAEIAGVLGHEIGHITGRHSAQRYSQAMAVGLGSALLGAVLGVGGDIAALGSQLYIQSFSREQEFEADVLGIRYLSRAGYHPQAMASFLGNMQRADELEARLEQRPPAGDQFSFMSTHPRTVDRVRQAMAAAAVDIPADPMIERDLFLRRLDGMTYGDDPSQGFVRGRSFAHPVLRIAFEVPRGFYLRNSQRQVTATGPDGALIVFDGARRASGQDMRAYLTQSWGAQLPLEGVEAINVNGLPGATAGARVQTNQGARDLRLVAIAVDAEQVYRFMFLTPTAATAGLSTGLRETTYSFRRLTPAQAAALQPLRLRIVTVRPGDTLQTMAARMAFDDDPLGRFLVLNGLDPGAALQPGQLVKIVTE